MFVDFGMQFTDKEFERVKHRLGAVYRQAARDIAAKTDDFWQKHKKRDEKYKKQVADGTLDIEDYRSWLRGQAFQGKQWREKAKQIAKTMADTDEIAQRIVDGGKLDIFATNANYVGYDIERHAGMDLGFGIYDSATVTRLVRDDPKLLPALSPKKVAQGKAIPFYQSIITNCVTQGIIQGEGIDKICGRIAELCSGRGYNAALRDARTAYTGAQNAGRIEGMRQARDDLGINVRKKWMATFDFRTRDAHRELDGQERGVDQPFEVDGDEILYPGDPTAKGYLIYNCRCALVYVYPEYKQNMNRRDNISGQDVGNMTYREWEKWKAGKLAAAALKGLNRHGGNG